VQVTASIGFEFDSAQEETNKEVVERFLAALQQALKPELKFVSEPLIIEIPE